MSLAKSSQGLGPSQIAQMIDSLLAWYGEKARELPWRASAEPYSVWISEIMSQQSTLAMMTPYYLRWIKRFPTVLDLAEASAEEVLTMWEGLGYYSRARNVHAASKILRQKHLEKGHWPQSSQEWLELPGVGPYTAAAVASICFDEAILPLDGNVTRVLARLLAIPDPLNLPGDRKKIQEHLNKLASALKAGTRGKMAQALMELGATVCRPANNASCELCPISSVCRSRQKDLLASSSAPARTVERTPRPKKRADMKKLIFVAPIYASHRPDEILLRQIPKGLRLAGQWELPQMDVSDISDVFMKSLPTAFEVHGPVFHTITHHHYRIYGVKAGSWGQAPLPSGHRFFSQSFLLSKKSEIAVKGRDRVTITTATRKLLHFLVDSAS
jgi:A/G-specific adenine glycosylase